MPSHWRKTIQLRCVWKGVHQGGQDGEARGHAQEEGGARGGGTDVTAGGARVLAWPQSPHMITCHSRHVSTGNRLWSRVVYWISVKRAWWRKRNILILLTSQHTQVISNSCHKHNNICRVTQAILTWLITLETQWLCRSFGKFCKFLEFSFFSLEKNQI